MKILLAPDSFKGSMTSMEVIDCLERVARRHFDPVEIVKVPVADGGEGTVDALVAIKGGEYRYIEVTGPLGDKVKVKYGIIESGIVQDNEKKTAVIEMAQASGLPLLAPPERNPLLTTTYGTGEIIKDALDLGIRDFIIGIGGSATNDGGIGAAQALGVRFTDSEGNDVGYGGRELSRIRRIDIENRDKRLGESNIIVICDVNNPLTGDKGATMVFGPQKGATPEMLAILEEGMKNYARVIRNQLGIDVDKIPGSGAAGGLGAALVCFLGAQLKPGIDTILDFADFERLLEDVDLVITGEGRIDRQSVFGKVPVGIAKRCKNQGVKVVAIAGSMGEGAQEVYKYGIESIMPIVNKDMCLDEAISRAGELLEDAADRMFRLVKLGMDMK
ncbi:MAG: glycerate kinase [Clostridiaceae bacterium]|nr:glycerate kinase [Clostridiaceae bacterium]